MSTWNIHHTIHKLSFEPMGGGRRYGIQPPNVSDLSAYAVHFSSAFYILGVVLEKRELRLASQIFFEVAR